MANTVAMEKGFSFSDKEETKPKEARKKVLDEAKQIEFTGDELLFLEKYRSLKNQQKTKELDCLITSLFRSEDDIPIEDPVSYCHNCCNDALNIKKHGKKVVGKSDIDFRNYVFQQSILEFGKFQECDSSCQYNKRCIWKLSWPEIMQNMFSYWGNPETTKAPSRSDRAKKNEAILSKAIRKEAESDKPALFEFRLNNHLICENTYLRLTGLKMANSRVGENWTHTRLKYSNNTEYSRKEYEKKSKGDQHIAKKTDHCTAYIRFVAEYLGDAAVGETHIRILPYETALELYREYVAHYYREPQKVKTYFNDIGQKSTFMKAFRELKINEIRLRRSRGSFDTCAICNNLHDALKSTKLRWTDAQVCFKYDILCDIYHCYFVDIHDLSFLFFCISKYVYSSSICITTD